MCDLVSVWPEKLWTKCDHSLKANYINGKSFVIVYNVIIVDGSRKYVLNVPKKQLKFLLQ